MGSDKGLLLRAAVVLAAAVSFAIAAGFISNDALPLHATATGRTLLQTKKDCPVNFEGANFTIITSRCTGPLYPPSLCCPALQDFACPYSAYVNDITTNCNDVMFNYINMYGQYPPGIFSNYCLGNDHGMACPASIPQIKLPQKAASSAAVTFATPVALVVVAAMSVLFS